MRESDQLQAICMDAGIYTLQTAALKLMNLVRKVNRAAGRTVCAYSVDSAAVVSVLTTDIAGFLAALNIEAIPMNDKLKAK